MRKILFALAMVALFCVNAQAEPWLVCDAQSDATGYIYKLNGGADVTVPYATQVIGGQTVAVIADCASLPVGVFTYEVKAYKDDPVWGRLESAIVPFSATRPGASGAPSNVGIKR